MAMIRSSIGRYLPYSLAATTAVVGVPLLMVALVALGASTPTPVLAAAFAGIFLSIGASAIGSLVWRRRPESMDLSFGELMIWSFVRRQRAEQRLQESAAVLGLDGGGRPVRRMPLTKRERLRVLHGLATALETKDPYTHGHSTRVEALVAHTAKELNLSDYETDELRTAASLHDVGKIRVPNSILRKADRLTIEEQLIVQEHAAVGAWMVVGVSNGKIAGSVRHHHERWDGNGYPDGLAGSDIPLFARVIAVADSYDAMTSTRPYRPSLSSSQAIEELEREAGRQFDPEVVEAFLATVARRVPFAGVLGLGLFTGWLRRTTGRALGSGSTNVAPAVGAVGAASVLIASVFAPPVALTRPTPKNNVRVTDAAVTDAEIGIDSAARSQQDKNGGERKSSISERRETKADVGGAKGRRGDETRVLGNVLVRKRSQPGVDDGPGSDGGDTGAPSGGSGPNGGSGKGPGGGDRPDGGGKDDPGHNEPPGNDGGTIPPGKDDDDDDHHDDDDTDDADTGDHNTGGHDTGGHDTGGHGTGGDSGSGDTGGHSDDRGDTGDKGDHDTN